MRGVEAARGIEVVTGLGDGERDDPRRGFTAESHDLGKVFLPGYHPPNRFDAVITALACGRDRLQRVAPLLAAQRIDDLVRARADVAARQRPPLVSAVDEFL